MLLIRFELTIMPVVTFVQNATDAHGEQFFIDNADVGNHHGHFTWSLTEAQFRDSSNLAEYQSKKSKIW